ncbi:MAG: hypothetical protein K1X74_08310 [Pirellulales bacterium]|nr:hypothetical protein [Pirellulales bacterium]
MAAPVAPYPGAPLMPHARVVAPVPPMQRPPMYVATAPAPPQAPVYAPTAPPAVAAPVVAPVQAPVTTLASPQPAEDIRVARVAPPLDPNQPGNLEKRLEAAEKEIATLEKEKAKSALPNIKLSGFFQLDHGSFAQDETSRMRLGDIEDGFSFRRARLQALGKLTDFTNFSLEMDFGTVGRPSFQDVWGEQTNLPFFGTLRIGQFRQPTTMDCLTSIRHLEFLERSAPFQAFDPFRRVGIMAYNLSESEMTQWAYSVYGTGFTFFDGVGSAYSTLGDNRFGAQIGDRSGVSFVTRVTHLLYYDEPSDGRYLLHVGGGYNYSQIGGNGNSGTTASTYEARPIPEFFVGDLAGAFTTRSGVPGVLDTGRILSDSFSFYHGELAGNFGAAHFQTEAYFTDLNQRGGPTLHFPGAYVQCGYFLTGETCRYIKTTGVLDYTVTPYSEFFGLGKGRGFGGWGAWEVAFRYSYVDLSTTDINPANQLSNLAGPPPAPDLGTLNSTTVALNWWWNQYARVQFNWIHSIPDYNGFGTAPFDIFATRFQVEF